MEPNTNLSLERQFELAKLLTLVDTVEDLEGLREVTRELVKLNIQQKDTYEHLLFQGWGF